MVTIGVIGAGYWGKNLVRTFYNLPSASLKYIVDASKETLDRFSVQYPDVIRTSDLQTVLDDPEVDAVAIATPPVTHHDVAKKALEAGKHVMVEKPMTLDVDHARELVALADENDLRLMVGHLLLYHPCVVDIKRSIEDGEIGDVFYLYCQRLNLGKVRSDENALQSFAPHDISVAVHLLGDDPVSVSANGNCYLQSGIEDVVFLNLTYPDGKVAHVHVSWLDPHKVRRTTVVGSKKMVVFDDMEPREKIKVYDKGVDIPDDYGSYGEYLTLRDGNISIPAIKMNEPLKCECDHFIDCVATHKTPISDGRNGLIVTQILDAAQKSLKSGGKPVSLLKLV